MVSDSELAIAAASGDRGALADIYDRYANTLYELCRVILGDAHEAADSLHDTFVIAATRLGGLREPDRLKPWLCAIARHESLRRSSRRARSRPAHDAVLDVPVIDTAASGLIAGDAADLVWDSAASLPERERAVLVLNVRQGLEGAALAAAAGLPGPTTSVLLSRAKTQLASAVRCTLLIRGGRDACTELAALTPRKHAALDALTRKRVTRHAAKCDVCEPKWNAAPEALGVLAAAPLLGAPVAMRHQVLNDPRLISFSSPLGDGHWHHDGFPPDEVEEGSRRRVVAWLAAAVVTLLVATGLVLASQDEPQRLATGRGGTPTTDAAEFEDDFEPWPTSPPPAENTTTTRKGATTTTAKRAPTTTRPATGAAPTATTAAPTTAAPAFSISAGMRENTLGCNETGHVTATTTGQPDGMLIVQWRDASGSGGGTNMQKTGANTWSGTAGPFNHAGTWTWWVQDFPNGARSSTHTIDVVSTRDNPC